MRSLRVVARQFAALVTAAGNAFSANELGALGKNGVDQSVNVFLPMSYQELSRGVLQSRALLAEDIVHQWPPKNMSSELWNNSCVLPTVQEYPRGH